MKKMDIILSGLGGQGILFMTKVISIAAIKAGYRVLTAETHGMAQRGGSVVSHLRIGNPMYSLVGIGTAGYLISLDENETYRNLHFLSKNAKIFTNMHGYSNINKDVKEYLDKNNISCFTIKGTKIVKDFFAPLALNVALLGFFFSFKNKILSKKKIRDTIIEISPKIFLEINLKVFDFASKYKKII